MAFWLSPTLAAAQIAQATREGGEPTALRILLAAENFAFGPAGKMLALAAGLRPHARVLGFAGRGTAADLASRFPFDRSSVIGPPGALDTWEAVVREYDAVVSVMERDCAREAIRQHKPVVWVDTLFWWWTSIPAFLEEVDLYIIQRSLDASPNLHRFRPRIRNFLDVGPLIDIADRTWKPRARTLLVCFGGMEAEGFYEIGRESTYPYTLTRILLEQTDLSEFDEITIVGNSKVAAQLRERWADPRLRVETLAHDKFLDLLTSAEVVLAIPGLETPLEAFYYGVPLIFLPPSNASQYCQLHHYRAAGMAPASVHFSDFMPSMDLQGLSREGRNAAFLVQLRDFEQSAEFADLVASRLTAFVKDRCSWRARAIEAGHEYVESLGGNGLPTAITAIRTVLEASPSPVAVVK